MKRLVVNASDEDLLRAVHEWIGILAEEQYQSAYDFLYHPWLPTAPVNEYDADSIKSAVTGDDGITPHRFLPDAPFKVTPVETAPRKEGTPNDERKPYQDVHRYETPEEHAWDDILVRHGGTASGAAILGTIHFDLPLNGQWSDLTAIEVVRYDGAVVLALESIDVL